MTLLLFLSILLGMSLLAWSFAAAGWLIASAALILLAGLWFVAEWRRWLWFADLALLLCAACGAAGLLSNLPAGGIILGTVAIIAAWDITHFCRRLTMAAPQDNTPQLVRQHLLALAFYGLIALVLSLGTTIIPIHLSFAQAIVLIIGTIAGTTLMLRWLQRQRNQPQQAPK